MRVVIDADELAVLMCEASCGLTRPQGMNGHEALEAMEPECREAWRRAAFVAISYLKPLLPTQH